MSGESYSDVCVELFSSFLMCCGISFSEVVGIVGGIWGVVVSLLLDVALFAFGSFVLV